MRIKTKVGIVVITLALVLSPIPVAHASPITAEKEAQLREIYDLDKPVVKTNTDWLGRMAKGDIGNSLQHQNLVTKVIHTHIWNLVVIAFRFIYMAL